MIEDALGEGTAGSGGTEGLGETEGLSDGEVSLDHDEGSSGNGLLTDDNTSTLGNGTVNTTYGIIGSLDFNQEDWLLEAGRSSKLASEEATTGSGGNLTTTSVDSVGVEGAVLNVNADTSHVLLSELTFLGGPLESGLAGVGDFVKVLALLGNINKQVGASSLGAEAPNLHGIIGVP